MIDVCTGWLELAVVNEPKSKPCAEIFDREWLCRYVRPRQCGYDSGGKFCGREFQEMLESYGIEGVQTTVKNPRAQAIVERMHLIFGEMIRTTVFGQYYDHDLKQLGANCAYALRSTVPTKFSYSPAQLALGADMLFRQRAIIDWEKVKEIHPKNSKQNNKRENSKRIAHEYKVGDKVLLLTPKYEHKYLAKISDKRNKGPYKITKIYANGNLRLNFGDYTDIRNVRNVKPFYRKN